MRDIALTLLLLGVLLAALKRPWIGALAMVVVGVMSPHKYTYGFAAGLPWAMAATAATVAGMFFQRESPRFPRQPEVLMLLFLALGFCLTSFTAIDKAVAWDKLDMTLKSMFMLIPVLLLFQDQRRFRWLLIITALAIGLIGLKGGVFALATGGSYRIWGPPGSYFEDNNSIGFALVVVSPMLLYLARSETHKWLRYLLWVCFAGCIVAAVFTYSRGAFLGLVVVGSFLLMRAKKKWLWIPLLWVGVIAALAFVPAQWSDRMGTIKTYDQDQSARGRLDAWTMAVNMANDQPLVGGGFRAFWTDAAWDRYNPGHQGRDAHSIYFEVLGEHGWLFFALYLALLLRCLWIFGRLRRQYRDDPDRQWVCLYAEMLQISLAAYMVSGAFLGLAYTELLWIIVAAAILLKSLAAQPILAKDGVAVVPAPHDPRPAHWPRPRFGRPQPERRR